MINVFQPELRKEELEAVRKVFESNWVGKGKVTEEFESGFAAHLGVERNLVRSVSCCTEGLFQSMTLFDIKAGDEVILPTINFVGAGNAVAASGARPIFCDVDKRTLNPTAEMIEQKITSKTKAVIILHYGGLPCEMDEICDLTRNRKIALIEDSACSVASKYKGKACGTIGDIGTWSFDSMKILVMGDGGMIYCKTPEMAKRAEELTYLGLLSKSGFISSVDSKWWEFEISCYGRRAIVNDIASAIGKEQLKKLPDFIKRRKEIHRIYSERLGGLQWLTLPPPVPSYMESSYYFYWIQTDAGTRDRLAVYLKQNGVYSTFRYYPLHLVKFYNSTERLRNAEEAAQETLCIPIHHSLSDDDLEKVVETVHSYGGKL